MQKKIAIIGSKGFPSSYSGLEVYVETMAEALANKGYEVAVFCRKRYCDFLTNSYKGVKVIYVPSINTKHLDAFTYSAIAVIEACLLGYDCFWFQALGPSLMMFIPKVLGKKIVSTVHGLDWKREKFGYISSAMLKLGEKQIAEYADRIIVLNRNDCDYFWKKYGADCCLIENGTTVKEKRLAKSINELFGISEGKYFLFMSRIVPEKKVEVLIDAFRKLETDMTLVIAGRGAHTNSYYNMVVDRAKGDGRIIFVGFVKGEIKEELYSNAFSYVLPSSIEGQSIGLIEAMSYGLPCIVSDIYENISTLGGCGYSFKEGNVEELTAVLNHVLSNKEEAVIKGNMAMRLAKKRYRWEDKIERTISQFD